MGFSSGYAEKSSKVDRLMETLRSELRREIIQYFENEAESRTVKKGALEDHLSSQIETKNKKEIVILLNHNHLPKLERNGWISVNDVNQTIHYLGDDEAEELLSYLTAVFADDNS